MNQKNEFVSLSIENYEEITNLWNLADLSIRPLGRDSKKNLKKQLESGVVWLLGIKNKEKGLIGIVMVSHDQRRGWINRLAIDPVYRRKGIAKILINEAEKQLRDLGIEVITALIEGSNRPSLSLFKKCGYSLHNDIVYVSKRKSPDS